MHAGKTIMRFQKEKGISGGDLSNQLGIAPQQLSRWRKSEDLKLSTIIRLCEVMGVDLDEFINASK